MLKSLVGLGLWMAAAFAAHYGYSQLPQEQVDHALHTVEDISRMAIEGPREVTFEFDRYLHLQGQDGVFVRDGDELRRIGHLTQAWMDGPKVYARAFLDPIEADAMNTTTVAIAMDEAGSAEWIVETLLPPHTTKRIRAEWETFWDSHRSRLMARLIPFGQRAGKEALQILLLELEDAFDRHQPELRGLLIAYREEILKGSFLPLLEKEVWPIVEENAEGPAKAIAQQIWKEMPLWGFAWRGVYDKVFYSDPIHVEELWQKTLREKILPIVRDNSGMLQETLNKILRAIVDNPAIQDTLGDSLLKLRDDKRVHSLLLEVGRELLTESPRFKTFLARKIQDPALQSILSDVGPQFEDFRKRVGNMIVLDENGDGINPDFAKFLRTLVMKKDWRWILLETSTEGGPLEGETITIPGRLGFGDT